MSRPRLRTLAGGYALACVLSTIAAPVTHAATTATVATEAALRAAIDAAPSNAVIIIAGNIELQSSIRITKPLTFRNDTSYSFGYAIGGGFKGELFQIAAAGITFENLRFYGSSADRRIAHRGRTSPCGTATLTSFRSTDQLAG